jgi:hypothetical protein
MSGLLYTLKSFIVSQGFGMLGWVSRCSICGRCFNRKIAGAYSPCHACKGRLLEAQKTLKALELASVAVKTDPKKMRSQTSFDSIDMDAPRASAQLLYFEVAETKSGSSFRES